MSDEHSGYRDITPELAFWGNDYDLHLAAEQLSVARLGSVDERRTNTLEAIIQIQLLGKEKAAEERYRYQNLLAGAYEQLSVVYLDRGEAGLAELWHQNAEGLYVASDEETG